MAGTWLGEQFDSRPGMIAYRELQSSRRYAVSGTESQDDVIALAASNVPSSVSVGGANQYLREIKYSPKGGGNWEVSGSYGFTRPSWELSGDSGGATAKSLRALSTIKLYKCQAGVPDAPDFRNAIGATADGVEGVDLVIPADNYAVTQKYQLSALSSTYLDTLRRLTGRTNDEPFTLSWQDQAIVFFPEECLYLGRTFKQTSTSEAEITHKFSGQESRLGGTVTVAAFTQPAESATVEIEVTSSELFTIGDTVYISTQAPAVVEHGTYIVSDVPDATHIELELTDGTTAESEEIAIGAFVSLDEAPISIGTSGPITKRGWHYLWTYNQRQLLGTIAAVSPKYAVVQKVYRTGSFSLFGL